MARDFNQNRNTNAYLGTVDTPIKKQGTFYAQSYGFDGLSCVKVDFPDFVKDFIQGNNDTFEYFVPNNVTSIRPYAFSGFPNLDNLTILNETQFVTIDTNAFNGTKIGNKEQGSVIYVVETYYDYYITNYGSLYNFASYESETWYVVNYEKVGTATLTKQLLNNLNIPLTFSGLVIASDITYVTSVSVSYLESITQIWLKGCNDLIFDLDELPNGWVYDNGTLYVSPSDYNTFIANHSGYENYIENGYTMTIIGNGTLTSTIVESTIEDLELTEVPVGVVNKVVIPVDFTSYASGSIAAIQNGLSNLRYLTTNYEAGPMELDLQGDIVAKIVEIGKTLDEALVYARTLNVSTTHGNDSNLIIAPPLYRNGNSANYFPNCANLVYIANARFTLLSIQTLINNSRPIEVNMTFDDSNGNAYMFWKSNIGTDMYLEAKRINFEFNGTVSITNPGDITAFSHASNIEHIIMKNYIYGFNISASTLFTRQALVDLINSLGTPETQQTLTIGATNLAKLTADDIAIATAKNWQLA